MYQFVVICSWASIFHSALFFSKYFCDDLLKNLFILITVPWKLLKEADIPVWKEKYCDSPISSHEKNEKYISNNYLTGNGTLIFSN